MKNSIRIALRASPEQLARLAELQSVFAKACNFLAPMVQGTRCWNRVALHHMAYKQLRERYPELGSQMACNAIYSVSRAARVVYQHPSSPFNVGKVGDGRLPTLQFAPHAPVFFDRHTLSLKQGLVSLFTLDGRMRFQLGVSAEVEQRFREARLREIVLSGAGSQYALTFSFAEGDGVPARESADWPEYVLVLADGQRKPQPLPAAPRGAGPAREVRP